MDRTPNIRLQRGLLVLIIILNLGARALAEDDRTIVTNDTIDLKELSRARILYMSLYPSSDDCDKNETALNLNSLKRFGDSCAASLAGSLDACVSNTINIGRLIPDRRDTCTVTSFLGFALQCSDGSDGTTANTCICAEVKATGVDFFKNSNNSSQKAKACLRSNLPKDAECISQLECADNLLCEFRDSDHKDCQDVDKRHNPTSKCWIRVCGSSETLLVSRMAILVLLLITYATSY